MLVSCLASWVDATVLLAQNGQSRVGELKEIRDTLLRNRARIEGVVLSETPNQSRTKKASQAKDTRYVYPELVKNAQGWTKLRMFAAIILASSASLIPPGQRNATAFAQIADAASNNTPALQARPETGLRIGAGDMVQVTVFDTPELSAKLRVNADGTVDLPVAGSTAVSGMTPQDAGDAIAKHLRDGQIMIDPRVTVTVTDYATQEVSVLGEVKNPGNYLLLGPHSLYNALSAAGGTTDKAGVKS